MSEKHSESSIYMSYLQDLSIILFELYIETSDDRDGFALGRHLALQEVLSLMQQQADAFCISRNSINLPAEDL